MRDDPGISVGAEGGETAGDEQRKVYQTFFEAMSDAAFVIDVERSGQDYTFTYRRTNGSHQRQTGLSEAELRGQTPQELLGDNQGTDIAEHYRRCVEQQETIRYAERVELPAGTRHLQTTLTPIVAAGEVTEIVGVTRDITEQNERERQRKRTNRRFKTVMDTMSAAVFLKDADGRYLMMNEACRELFNLGEQDIVDLSDADLFPPAVAEQAKTDDQQVIEEETMIEIEETIPTAAGDTVRLTRKSPVYDEAGEVVGLCGVSTDITEHKQREQELRTIRERFERFASNVEDAFFLLPTDYSETEYVNPAVERIYGITPEAAAEEPMAWLRHVHPDDREELLAGVAAQQDGTAEWPVTQEFRIEHPERGLRWVQARLDVVTDETGAPQWFTGVSTDVTEKRRYQAALDSLLDATQQMVSATTVEEVAAIVTTTVQESMGFPMNGVHLYDDAAGGLAPVDVSAKSKQVIGEPPVLTEGLGWQAYKTGNSQAYQTPQAADEIYNDQTDIQSEIAVPLGDHGVLLVSATEPDAFSEREMTLANTLAANASAVLSQINTYEQLQDREQTVAEQRDTLRIVNKIVRHDIRNDLQLIDAYADRLADHVDALAEPQKIGTCVTNAVAVTETAREVTEMVLRSEQADTQVRLSPLLLQQIERIDTSYPHAEITIEGQLPETEVVGDDMLASVFRNLLNNAVQHNDKEVPVVTVSVSQTESAVIVEIADNGPGIPDRHKETMFEEGNSGLESNGTGLGLYLVRQIVEGSNGRVEVIDNDPEGAVFIVKLATVGDA